MVKILIINVPFHGHVNPTIAITKELVDRGYKVTYLISEEFREEIALTGASIMLYDYNEKLAMSLKGMRLTMSKIYETALRIGKNYDLIIYEFMFFMGKHLGDTLKKPTIRLISMFAFNKNTINPKNSGKSSFKFKLIQNKLARKIFTQLIIGEEKVKNNDILTEVLENVPELNIVFTSRKFQIHSEQFQRARYKFIGPSIIKRAEKNNIPLNKLKEKVIYISLGTLFNKSLNFFQICLKAFSDVDMSIIMSIGKNVNIKDLGTIPDNFLVYQVVPQLDVLKRTNVFITHGGMNSANEAIYYGVPVITIPQFADQPAVARRLEELGLGIVIDKKNVSVETLKKALNDVLNNSMYKENMKIMSEDMINCGGYKAATTEIEKYIGLNFSIGTKYNTYYT
ncbi:glycosyl transferase [Clostridium bowmanii]|uniref:macrolide family glycosyltransferase n=1 Tax=Clostridium bowmanii TaxID=132925 RepID=UPI001C0AC402|nr:macrolide family glycosyltransferase [Clostridium bowmanii]MBU3189643.1 glycosyl transferase [Clostridium bowmanii]MCA1073511.1 glycosyl transferase [Clostridium bowmanii]